MPAILTAAAHAAPERETAQSTPTHVNAKSHNQLEPIPAFHTGRTVVPLALTPESYAHPLAAETPTFWAMHTDAEDLAHPWRNQYEFVERVYICEPTARPNSRNVSPGCIAEYERVVLRNGHDMGWSVIRSPEADAWVVRELPEWPVVTPVQAAALDALIAAQMLAEEQWAQAEASICGGA